jgi:hypothetical protein
VCIYILKMLVKRHFLLHQNVQQLRHNLQTWWLLMTEYQSKHVVWQKMCEKEDVYKVMMIQHENKNWEHTRMLYCRIPFSNHSHTSVNVISLIFKDLLQYQLYNSALNGANADLISRIHIPAMFIMVFPGFRSIMMGSPVAWCFFQVSQKLVHTVDG